MTERPASSRVQSLLPYPDIQAESLLDFQARLQFYELTVVASPVYRLHLNSASSQERIRLCSRPVR